MKIHYNGWKSYSFFFSAEHTQTFLKNKYRMQKMENPEQKGFENCYAFIYYLEHGQIYYKQAEKSPLILKPILVFYGLIHLIKACILTIDPFYPETTSVLAHGLSTRKRKKQHYSFFHDEVKFQKNGLFTYMAETLFHMEHLEGDKVTMEKLLRLIPELDDLFYRLENNKTFTILEKYNNGYSISENILDNYYMTNERMKEFLLSKFHHAFIFSNDSYTFQLKDDFFQKPAPLKYNFEKNAFVFPLYKSEYFHLPELLIHYLLLYNLGMIARYETEWWGELTKLMPTKDYPFIDSFINITLQKSPFLIYQYLVS